MDVYFSLAGIAIGTSLSFSGTVQYIQADQVTTFGPNTLALSFKTIVPPTNSPSLVTTSPTAYPTYSSACYRTATTVCSLCEDFNSFAPNMSVAPLDCLPCPGFSVTGTGYSRCFPRVGECLLGLG